MNVGKSIRRPGLHYFGSKWMLAPWIISHFPAHGVYVEPFGGGASVLLRKTRSSHEIYNDLDENVVRFFRVMRTPELFAALHSKLTNTPYSRKEYDDAFNTETSDEVELTRRFSVRMAFTIGHGNSEHRSGMRNSMKMTTAPASQWKNYVDHLPIIAERLRVVLVENLGYQECIEKYERYHTLFYIDPPYPRQDLNTSNGYRYSMTDDEHEELAELLHRTPAMSVVSGLKRSELYSELYSDWKRVDRKATTNGKRKNVESLWLSPGVVDKFNGSLFAGGTNE